MIDVKLFRITTGEEVVAELVSETDDTVTVQNGLVVLPTNTGVGFAPFPYFHFRTPFKKCGRNCHIIFCDHTVGWAC